MNNQAIKHYDYGILRRYSVEVIYDFIKCTATAYLHKKGEKDAELICVFTDREVVFNHYLLECELAMFIKKSRIIKACNMSIWKHYRDGEIRYRDFVRAGNLMNKALGYEILNNY